MDEPRTEGAGAPPPTWEDFVRENGERARQAGRGSIPDFAPLIAIVEALRRAIPHELQEQFNALQRELLLTLRALIDWYLERLDKPELTPQVEDIPIE
jgi:hypothetical protein